MRCANGSHRLRHTTRISETVWSLPSAPPPPLHHLAYKCHRVHQVGPVHSYTFFACIHYHTIHAQARYIFVAYDVRVCASSCGAHIHIHRFVVRSRSMSFGNNAFACRPADRKVDLAHWQYQFD